MKWYFACNDKDTNFFPLIKGAVNSALENTTLEPNFIYDGEENELTAWLKEKGVNIIHHRVGFYNFLKYNDENLSKIAQGAFLRCDIPIIETEDEFVLYTDCDVLFLKDFQLDLKPDYFACAPQSNKNDFKHFNTGVMLMNVKKLRESYEEFCKFIIKNLNILSTFDQTAYQIFYWGKCEGKCSKLPLIYNYKPYWGASEDAAIIHFHGCKPITFCSEDSLKNLPYSCYELYKKNPQAYDFYLDLFQKYLPEIEYNKEAIEKLKNGIYPLVKPKKTPLHLRINGKITKTYKKLIQNFKNKNYL